MHRGIKRYLLVAPIVAASAVAYAARNGAEDDAMAIATAKISLTQAVIVAEQHAADKAARAEYENSRDGRVYDVEVVSGAEVFDVRVDAGSGTVISSAVDRSDHDDDDDAQD